MHVWKELPCIPLDSCGIGYTPLSDGAPTHMYYNYIIYIYVCIYIPSSSELIYVFHQKETKEIINGKYLKLQTRYVFQKKQ